MREARLDFEINAPDLTRYNQYRPILKKISNGAAVEFQNLSSGEKVLVCLAFCMYNSTIEQSGFNVPKILLLDEIDSPLHPSMSRNVLDVTRKAFVETFGVKVIATTHSPTTVALAPEGCIFSMDATRGSLEAISKTQALDLLTSDVPTLSLSFEGRRQVFVESPADAKTYDAVYQLYKGFIASARSLHFVATGTGSINSGCDIVKQVVSNLVATGNQSVFGLLDWDGKHDPSNRIAVLGHRRRNGLENVLFDPLLIAAVITRDFRNKNSSIGVNQNYALAQFAESSLDEMQQAVDSVISAVLTRPNGRNVSCCYKSGIILQLDKAYLEGDDHGLEARILDAFPFLQTITKNKAGQLMQYIIEKVLYEAPDLVPNEILEAFTHILEQSAHTPT